MKEISASIVNNKQQLYGLFKEHAIEKHARNKAITRYFIEITLEELFENKDVDTLDYVLFSDEFEDYCIIAGYDSFSIRYTIMKWVKSFPENPFLCESIQ